MKYIVTAAFCLQFATVAAAAAPGSLPTVSAQCQAEAAAMARACPIGKDFAAFMACKQRNSSLNTPKCTAEIRAHLTALAAACRRDEAPPTYAKLCPSFKANPKAF